MIMPDHHWLAVAGEAAKLVARNDGDRLIVLPLSAPNVPGSQTDDEIRAVAAIDLLRHLVAEYEETEEPWCNHDPVAVIDGVCECGDEA